jgi:predicted peptidase
MAFVERSVSGHKFKVHVPGGVTSPPPAILFLHGRGESGRDGRQTDIGLPPAVLAAPERWPFVVVCPQKPTLDTLWPDWTEMLEEILAAVDEEFPSDPSRRYLTGLSQGGHGTLRLATALSWRFAAIAPVCGWGDPMRVALALRNTPTWLFHGTQDPVVPASCSISVADCMTGEVSPSATRPRLTLYPGLGHDSWTAAYAEPELPGWFLSHRLAEA